MKQRLVMGLSKLRGLSKREKRLVFSAWMMLWSLRLGLWFNPSYVIQRIQRRSPKRHTVIHYPVYQILWAIQFCSYYVPGSTFLAQSLAAKTLLARYGYESKLHMGVAQNDQWLEAHAWLTHDGQVVLGDVDNLSRYRPMSSAKGQKQTLIWRS
jgi:hypothetical protein